MTGIIASFVVAKRGENLIGISSRSLGEVNVQLIMENLGGGAFDECSHTDEKCYSR